MDLKNSFVRMICTFFSIPGALVNFLPNSFNFFYIGLLKMIFMCSTLDDVTFMKETELLNEWILEEVGKIWVGPHTSTKGRHWVYGQFDDSVLPLIMILLEKSGLPFPSRGNPILVSRALTKMVRGNLQLVKKNSVYIIM